ncbi:phosphomannomutase/phosphoglucomutase [Syntrophomonas erecta]
MLAKSVFRQYDIRGKVGVDFDVEGAKQIAAAFARYAMDKGYNKMLVGRDNRKSSQGLRNAVVDTLMDMGLNVYDLGEVITPVFYFAGHYLDIYAGIMITASHNPAQDNGFKLLLGKSTIYGEEIQKVARMALANEYQPRGQSGFVTSVNLKRAYLLDIKSRIKLGRKLKVVADCGNGTAGGFVPDLLEELGCDVIKLYCHSDPEFPNHHPDPVKEENCQDLIRVVQREKADLGIGFDGDGDRLGVVSPQGQIIWGDMLMILYWREIIKNYPGADCIVEVKCSQALIDEIKKMGGKPTLHKTGHSLIKAKMQEIGAVFTGEMSGHMFFADEYYGYDDALYAAARLLRILSYSDRSLDELLADVPEYYATPEIRVPSSDEEKFAVVKQVQNYFKQHYEVIDIDGARVLFPGGWGLVRASNTGPELILRCEGSTPQQRDAIYDEVTGYLQTLGVEV